MASLPRAVRAAALLVALPRMYGNVTGAPIIHDPDQCCRFAAANDGAWHLIQGSFGSFPSSKRLAVRC